MVSQTINVTIIEIPVAFNIPHNTNKTIENNLVIYGY